MTKPNVELFLSLAEMMGIRPEVQRLLHDAGDMRPHGINLPLSELLTNARMRKNLSIPQINARTGLSRSQLNFYESGHQKNPGLRTIHALAWGYELPLGLVLLSTLHDMIPLPKVKKGIQDVQTDRGEQRTGHRRIRNRERIGAARIRE